MSPAPAAGDAASEPKVKGVAFRSIEMCFAELRGTAARDKARDLMRTELSGLYKSSMVLAASWYPITWYKDALRAFRAATGDGPELARQIGRLSVQIDMKSVYKMVFARIVSPQTLLSLSAKLFNQYYDTGAFEVVESRRGYVLTKMSGCVGWDQNMWTEVTGSCGAFLEIAGAKSVRLHVRSGGKENDTAMELEAHWV